MYLSGRAKR
ncbi:uncharacterized protein FFE2_01281 [Fusarium fujikuroi]|nr:uncharacterized protein FFE2_01281 [Fusarium fujikuroi]